MKKRFHVIVGGRVQGVCFRAYTKKTADALGLTGWVRNLPTGQVETVFEGDHVDVQAMLSWCRQGPPLAHVSDIEIIEESITESFRDFRILY